MIVPFVTACCLFSSGCTFPYAYPHVSCVPPVDAGPQHEEVRAIIFLHPIALGQADGYRTGYSAPIEGMRQG
jgi:hypothetical protein